MSDEEGRGDASASIGLKPPTQRATQEALKKDNEELKQPADETDIDRIIKKRETKTLTPGELSVYNSHLLKLSLAALAALEATQKASQKYISASSNVDQARKLAIEANQKFQQVISRFSSASPKLLKASQDVFEEHAKILIAEQEAFQALTELKDAKDKQCQALKLFNDSIRMTAKEAERFAVGRAGSTENLAPPSPMLPLGEKLLSNESTKLCKNNRDKDASDNDKTLGGQPKSPGP